MTIWGYLRVSTIQQSINTNKEEIKKLVYEKQLGFIEPDNWIQETVSGRKDWRKRKLGEAFQRMQNGDILVMSEYSRIGRDFLQSIEFMSECRRKNITIYSTLGDIPINNDAISNLMLSINAWKAQTERETLAYRTKIGIQHARENGSILGRKKVMVLDKDEKNLIKIKQMLSENHKMTTIAKEMKCTTATLIKYIKLHNLKEIKPKNLKKQSNV